MESTRQKKVSRLIQKELSFILQTNAKEIVSNIIVSITKVNVSSDFSNATIYISIFPVKDPENVLNLFAMKKNILRKRLAEKIRHQLRKIPDLRFVLDDSADYAERIENLLKK
tara:strand:+ start:992 stop:1330 length:339 start_codon:yes stop_codon:yes gene_type:complete